MQDDQTPFLTPERGFLLFRDYKNLETVYPQITQIPQIRQRSNKLALGFEFVFQASAMFIRF